MQPASSQRCRILLNTDRRFDADAVHGEVEEWLDASGDRLPQMRHAAGSGTDDTPVSA